MQRLLIAWQEAVFELYLAATMSTWCLRSSRKWSRTCGLDGWYSNKSRGMRKKAAAEASAEPSSESED